MPLSDQQTPAPYDNIIPAKTIPRETPVKPAAPAPAGTARPKEQPVTRTIELEPVTMPAARTTPAAKPRRKPVQEPSAPSAPRQNTVLQQSENGIVYDQDFRPHEFFMQTRAETGFLKNCIYNTVHVTLPDKVHIREYGDIHIRRSFQSFYLNFHLFGKDGSPLDLPDDMIRIQDITRDVKDSFSLTGDHKTLQITMSFSLYKDDEIKGTYIFSEHGVTVTLLFSLEENQTQTVQLKSNLKSSFNFWSNLKKGVLRLIGNSDTEAQKPGYESPMLSERKFSETTPIGTHRLFCSSMETLTDNSPHANETEIILETRCFHSLFQPFRCPVCSREHSGMGIPGIVLFGSDSNPVRNTSSSILKYLTETENIMNTDLFRLAQTATAAVLKQARINDLSPDTPQAFRRCPTYIRIPLGKMIDGRIEPFRRTELPRLQKLLLPLNQALSCDGHAELTWKGKLYLLNSGAEYAPNNHDSNSLIHQEMIYPLCDRCWSPLPPEYYKYYTTFSFMIFGNTNAGKTVILCTDYNTLKQSVSETAPAERDRGLDSSFRFYSVRDTAYAQSGGGQIVSSNETDDANYERKADMLRAGQFPPGTAAELLLPILLCSLPKRDAEYLRVDYLFSYIDMAGKLSAVNWHDNAKLIYVYNLMEAMQTFYRDEREDSFYHQILHAIPKFATWTCNLQFYLSKIDEYPDFIFRKIQRLNTEWRVFFEEQFLEPGRSPVSLHEYRMIPNVNRYYHTLLAVLDREMQRDLFAMPADRIIREGILTVIIRLLHLEDYDFTQEFGMVLADLTDMLADENSPAADEQYRTLRASLIAYLTGLCTVQANYRSFRKLYDDICQHAAANHEENPHSRFYFPVYAVSATGYSAAESHAAALGLIDSRVSLYHPDFVEDAHRMLQYTTLEFSFEEPADEVMFSPEFCKSACEFEPTAPDTEPIPPFRTLPPFYNVQSKQEFDSELLRMQKLKNRSVYASAAKLYSMLPESVSSPLPFSAE